MRRSVLLLSKVILVAACFFGIVREAHAQVTVPSANTNTASDRKPFGSFYGYERTHALYTATEIGATGTITSVGFFVNSVSSPATTVPVVIRMKMAPASTVASTTYATAISGATTVWSGNITSGMLSANNWVTLTLTTSFAFTGGANNLQVFVETNATGGGSEGSTAKQFRWSSPGATRCQTWEDDGAAPLVAGTTTTSRPNIQLGGIGCSPAYSTTYPYSQSFESWSNCTSTTDVPSANYLNTPATGDNSWRRNDQQASAGWGNPTLGAYSPAASLGSFSARFHSYQASSGNQGSLDLYLNCTAGASTKQIKFDYVNTNGSDVLAVLVSTTGPGGTFTQIGSNLLTSATFVTQTFSFTSTSATTVIRLRATSDFGTTDIGVDNFIVQDPPCTPTYSTTYPYSQSFESWSNCTSTTDVPSSNYLNTPATGDNSWRRNDQQASAGWGNPTLGAYSPAASLGSFSARFHSYQASSGAQGSLDLYLNCTAGASTKQVKFDYVNTSGSDVLALLVSTTGPGGTFTQIGSNLLTSATFVTQTFNFTSTSATTVIRLRATSDFGTTDIGVDNFIVQDQGLLNDLVCSATTLVFGANGPYSNVGGTVEPGEPFAPANGCNVQNGWCEAGITNTVWFKFTAPASGRVSIDVNGFDTQAALYSSTSATCGNILVSGQRTLLAANDDGGTANGSLLNPVNCLTSGTVYYLQVDGYNGAAGSATITLTDLGAVTAALTPSTDQSFCSGGATTARTVSTNAAGTAAGAALSWTVVQSGVTGGSSGSGSSIASQTLTTTGASSGTATYTGVATISAISPATCAFTSAPVVVTVNPLPVISSVTATPTAVCNGANSQLLATVTTPLYTNTTGTYALQACGAGAGPSGDDAVMAATGIGFSFTYFGVTYTQFTISTNGNIQLGDGTGSTNNPAYSNAWTDVAIPNATAPNNYIALAWDDWLPSAGQITYGVTGSAPNRKLVVCFNTTGRGDAGSGGIGTLNGQIVLEETTNKIYLNSTSVTSNTTLTQGIEDQTGAIGLAVSGRNSTTAWTATNEQQVFAPLTYSWSPSTFLSSTTIANPVATAMTSNQNYTVTVTSGAGCVNTGSTGTIAVQPVFSAGAVGSGDQSFCASGTPNAMSVTGAAGSASFSYQWYSQSGIVTCPSGSTIGSFISLGTSGGANTATYTPPAAISTSTTYACFVTPGGTPTCGTAQWANGCRKITVTPRPTATLAGNGPFCGSGAPQLTGNLTGTGPWSITYTTNGGSPATVSGIASSPYTINPTAPIITTTTYAITAITDATICPATSYPASVSVTVNPLPVMNCGTYGPACTDAADIILGGSPAGGTWTGTGVSGTNPNYVFDPSVGGQTLNYSFTDGNNCTNSCMTTITVNPLPVVTCPPNSSVCVDAPAYSLVNSGENPTGAGGTFSGTGVTGNMFDPATAGAGTHTIQYCYVDGNGCDDCCNYTITVNALPVVTCPPNSSVCVDAPAYSLVNSGENPTGAGGTFSGTGVTGNMFDPATAGAGTHTIQYCYVDGNGCDDCCTYTITVNALPTITCPGNSTVCTSTPSYALTGANPPGGNYSGGAGVSGGNFDAALAGPGVHTITYSYTDGNGCTNTPCTFTITVEDADTDEDGTPDYCDGCPLDDNKTAPGNCGCGNPDPGSACDDGLSTTGEDTVQPDCSCLGVPVDCNYVVNGTDLPGTPCDDGNPDTQFDTWSADCLCEGQLGDCLGVAGGTALPGSSCDDGEATTGNDVYLTDCTCEGQFIDCEGTPGGTALVATPCDDGLANTADDMWDATCTCVGTPFGCQDNEVALELGTDGAGAQTSWEILPSGSGPAICSGSGYADNSTITVTCCLPDGCYRLAVYDSFNDGMTVGGYRLTDENGARIIDNWQDGVFQGTSAIANNGTFCLPLGTDAMQANSCDVLTLMPTSVVAAVPNAAVTAQNGIGSNTDDGYQFWIYDPDGSYSRTIFKSITNPGQPGTPVGPTAPAYLKLSSIVTSPVPNNVKLNIKVRSRVNGVYAPYGPACTMMIDVLNQCPTTSLVSTPGAQYSCGATGKVVGASGNTGKIFCTAVAGVNKYQWRFKNTAQNYTRTIASATATLPLNAWATNPLLCGTFTYEVSVRVSFNGGTNYCPYGAVCNVGITNGGSDPCTAPFQGGGLNSVQDEDEAGMRMWPNPVREGNVSLEFSGLSSEITEMHVTVIDLFGKTVLDEQLRTDGAEEVRTTLTLGTDIASGLYMVNATAGTTTYTERLMVE
ncbi:MAG: T9SS type A sorting domain-containing protein [Flavobacteriales bacterium]